jgi:hypothetical protein
MKEIHLSFMSEIFNFTSRTRQRFEKFPNNYPLTEEKALGCQIGRLVLVATDNVKKKIEILFFKTFLGLCSLFLGYHQHHSSQPQHHLSLVS